MGNLPIDAEFLLKKYLPQSEKEVIVEELDDKNFQYKILTPFSRKYLGGWSPEGHIVIDYSYSDSEFKIVTQTESGGDKFVYNAGSHNYFDIDGIRFSNDTAYQTLGEKVHRHFLIGDKIYVITQTKIGVDCAICDT